MITIEKWSKLLRHIDNVRDNAINIASVLIERGDEKLARELMQVALQHDVSKFKGIEWEYLWEDYLRKPEFKKAIKLHYKNNKHHPEYWRDIQRMPLKYIAEMVCDWHARCKEFDKDFVKWIKIDIKRRWKISIFTLRKIHFFANILDGRVPAL